MRIAFIHKELKLGTGASFINDLISNCLQAEGVKVKNFYPKNPLMDAPVHLKGLANILFFYSLLELKSSILRYDLVQGTTYTPLAFLPFRIPVVSHFGSTTQGFLNAVPRSIKSETRLRRIWLELKKAGVINELNIKTTRPLRDVAEIEKFVACRASAVIATSGIVRQDLLAIGVPSEKIYTTHNAIEDYWFENDPVLSAQSSLIFLGRIGSDVFTLNLKGLDRLIDLYRSFPEVDKLTVGITTNARLTAWMDAAIPRHRFHPNVRKNIIPSLFAGRAGDILLITSRYEGFSLSLIEGMSRGLIPVIYAVGIAPEIIKNGENGFLVTSQQEAKDAIAKILALPTEARRAIAAAARKTSERFTARTIAHELVKVYGAVIHAHEKKQVAQVDLDTNDAPA